MKKQEKLNKKFLAAVQEYTNYDPTKDFEKSVNGTSDIAKIIKKGADINAKNANNDNALMIALKGQEPIKVDLVKFLIQEGINLTDDMDTTTKKTVLEHAAEIEDHNAAMVICKALVKKGLTIYNEEEGIDAVFLADEACNDKLVSFFEQKLLGSDKFIE